jgi:hypothetical protein
MPVNGAGPAVDDELVGDDAGAAAAGNTTSNFDRISAYIDTCAIRYFTHHNNII